VDMTGAVSGSDGSVCTPACPGGYAGPFCAECPVGTWRGSSGRNVSFECRNASVSLGDCIPCSNRPGLSVYTASTWATRDCPFSCLPGYFLWEGVCVTPLDRLMRQMGGAGVFWCTLVSVAALVVIAFWGICTHVRGCPGYRHATLRAWQRKRDASLPGIGASPGGSKPGGGVSSPLLAPDDARQWYTTRVTMAPNVTSRLGENELPRHAYRFYLEGYNTPSSPWRLSTFVPEPMRLLVYADSFETFAEAFNERLSWQSCGWEEATLLLLRVLCFPLSYVFLRARQRHRLREAIDFVTSYDHACMRGPRARSLQNALKFGFSPCAQLAYLDLLYDEVCGFC
jgi:hypothetical protein